MDNYGKIFKNAFNTFKSHWLMNVIIVFVVAVIVNGYSMSTNTVNSLREDYEDQRVVKVEKINDEEVKDVLQDRITGNSNATVIENLIAGISGKLDQDITATPGRRYTKGVISVFVNQISDSGSVAFGILSGFNTLVFKDRIAESVLIFISAVIMFFVTIFVKNVFYVGQCRYFIEHRIYKNTGAEKLLTVFKYGKVTKVAKVIFMQSLFQFLWSLTIVGGIIKKYEYSMVPYICAENPGVKWDEALKLSKELTNYNKFKIFGLDFILAIGYLISGFTFNAISTFFLDPYKACVYAEVYGNLRKKAIENKFKGYELLNDRGLDGDVMRDSSYPEQMFPYELHPRRKWIKIDYKKNYTVTTLILFFFTFAFVGWVWEVFYTLVTQGILANRGTLNGPYLPIYGFGGILIIVLLKPLRNHPIALFLGAFTVCGILEYFTSWALEVLFDTKWWDYTDFYLNINGRICLEGLLVFGLAGFAFTYIVCPLLDNLYKHIKPSARKIVCIVLPIIFAVDLVFSAINPNTGAGVTIQEDELTETTADQA